MPSLQRPLPRLESFLLTPFCQAPAFVGFWSRSQWRTQAEVQDVHEKEDSPQSGMATSSDFNDFRFRSALIRIHDFMRNQQTMPMLFACYVILQCGLHKIESHGFSLLREPSEVLSLAIHMWRPRRCCGPCLVWYVWSHVLHVQHMQPCNTCKTRNTRHTRNTRKTRNFKSDLNISGADCSIQVALIWIWLEDLEPWLSSRLIFKSFIVFHSLSYKKHCKRDWQAFSTKKNQEGADQASNPLRRTVLLDQVPPPQALGEENVE